MNKPVRKAVEDDLPSMNSADEDDDDAEEGDWDSNSQDSVLDSGKDEASTRTPSPDSEDSNAEMAYETAPRKRRPSWDPENEETIDHLPTKLVDGRIKKSASKPTALAVVATGTQKTDESDYSDAFDEDEAERLERYRVEDVSTGARFGRPAVADVIATTSRKARIQGAKDQIAGICQEIIADPENNVNYFTFNYRSCADCFQTAARLAQTIAYILPALDNNS